MICPNCEKKIHLEQKSKDINGNKADVWGCNNCALITVLDWRPDEDE